MAEVNDIARLMRYVMPEPNSGCWLWIGAESTWGQYGSFHWRGQTWLAHRVSYLLFRGEIPDGMEVCHTCDTHLCINPSHLWLGTHADNMADKSRKGRAPAGPWQAGYCPIRLPGESNPSAKLTEEQVVTIRRLYAAGGITQCQLANQYGVSQSAISLIVLRKKWRKEGEI